MSLIPLLVVAATKAKQDQERAARVKSNLSREAAKKASSSSSYSYPKVVHKYKSSYDSFNVSSDLVTISSIKEGLLPIIENMNSVIKEKERELTASVQEMAPLTLNIESDLAVLETSMQEFGLTVTDSKDHDYGEYGTPFAVGVETTSGYGFGGIGKYAYNIRTVKSMFNGVYITKEMIENHINPYANELKIFDSKNPNLENQYQEILKELKPFETKMKLPLMKNRIENNPLYIKLMRNKSKLEYLLEQRKELVDKSNKLESLTEEQRNAILAYFKKADEIIAPGVETLNTINESIRYSVRQNDIYNEILTPEYLKELIDNGTITLEDITRIYDYVDGINNEDPVITDEVKEHLGSYSSDNERTRKLIEYLLRNREQVLELVQQKHI